MFRDVEIWVNIFGANWAGFHIIIKCFNWKDKGSTIVDCVSRDVTKYARRIIIKYDN